jgi:hypothetical protein
METIINTLTDHFLKYRHKMNRYLTEIWLKESFEIVYAEGKLAGYEEALKEMNDEA